MKKTLFLIIAVALAATSFAQVGIRPDALPWEPSNAKPTLNMATTVAEMSGWDRYPTYETYVAMMQGYAQSYPALCRLDTIGTTVQGRLILALAIIGNPDADNREFFYSSTIHGDEVTGFYFMLHLIDTLLTSYGTDSDLTQLMNNVDIYINPLANPDGTYYGGNNSVSGSRRYNANNVDLNRNYPDPFGTAPISSQQQENTFMINYVSQHHFVMGANLHGGSEVVNYPWDSFTSSQRPHPDREWWEEIGKRFVDTVRSFDSQMYTEVCSSGVIEGGDWYVIPNGRQDYMNYVHGIYEATIEVSVTKTLGTNYLKSYWNAQSHSLINYIKEIYNCPNNQLGINEVSDNIQIYPNPTHRYVRISGSQPQKVVVSDMQGRTFTTESNIIDLGSYPNGVYIIRVGSSAKKIVKY